MSRGFLLSILLLAAGAARAENEPVYAITGATVLPVSGPPKHRGIVLFQKGKILKVGSELAIPEGAVVHAADGKYVTPGLVAIEAALSNARPSPGNFADNLDPYHRDLKIALASGITTLQVVNTGFGGFFGPEFSIPSGRNTAVIKATVGDLSGMLVKEPSSIYFPMNRSMLSMFQQRENFQKARDYLKKLEEAQKNKAKPPELPRGLELHVEALKRELPVFVTAGDRESIRAVLEIRREFPFDLVLAGARDGWMMAAELSALQVPVLVKARGPDFNFNLEEPLFEEGGMIPIRRPAAYAEAGVRVGLLPYRRGVSLDGLPGRDLTALIFEAAFAVRGGMKESDALRAVTLEPARILRLAERLGSLEEGKDADLLIWSGHPLHYRSVVEKAWINGKLVFEREKSHLFTPPFSGPGAAGSSPRPPH
ncbi:MAG: amidohydrolase family protein [Planctomycetes bacterium]|nr:amidohydrolase family protein [Planctomycetota bacterium]